MVIGLAVRKLHDLKKSYRHIFCQVYKHFELSKLNKKIKHKEKQKALCGREGAANKGDQEGGAGQGEGISQRVIIASLLGHGNSCCK